MKFDFKKIASVLASVVMLGSTIGIAAASTNYPAPFVAGGAGDVAIIYGGDKAAFSDGLAAGEFKYDLQVALSKQSASTSATTATAAGGDSVQVTKSADKLNLGNGLTEIWGTAITKDDLKTVLADGKFYNKQNTEYKYTQKIDLGNLTFTDFSDSDYSNRLPTLGFYLSSTTRVANYTLDFETDPEATQGTDLTDFENKNIDILGKKYYILDFKNSTAKITLLDSATSTSLNEGESKTVSAGGKDYAVSISFISTDEVILSVNAELTDKLSATGTTYGNTYKLSDGTYIGVKNINVQPYAGGSKSVEFSVGKGKLEITDGSTLKINDKSVLDLTGYITLGTSSTKRTWQKLVMMWKIDDEAFLTDSKELLMPGFEAIKFTMANTTIPVVEKTRILASNEVLELKTSIKDGDVTVPLFYISTTTGNITGIGKSATQKLATTNETFMRYNATSGSSQYDGFVASWAGTRDAESYYLQFINVRTEDGKNRTSIKNKITNTNVCSDNMEDGQTCSLGSMTLTIEQINYTSGGDRLIGMHINAGGSFNKLYTKEGMLVYLPFSANIPNAGAGAIGEINISGAGASSFYMNLSEEDKDGTLDQKKFGATITYTGTGTKYITVSAIHGTGTKDGAGTSFQTPNTDSKKYESYVFSDLATRIVHDQTNTNQYSADVEYHGSQVYANLFVASPSATVAGGGTGTTGTGTVSELGNVVVKDNELSSVSTKNLVVVGGSCINTVAATIIGSTTPLCGADFTAKTNVSANQALVKVVDAATAGGTAGKIAMLIAGYEAADTTKAVKWVTTEKPITDKDTTKTLSTSATVATVVA